MIQKWKRKILLFSFFSPTCPKVDSKACKIARWHNKTKTVSKKSDFPTQEEKKNRPQESEYGRNPKKES